MKDIKGFTLIELLIVIAIMGITSSIGYTVINRFNKSVKENQITHTSQQNANLINKYLSKDLEQSIGIEFDGLKSNNTGVYKILIYTKDNSNPRYEVNIYDKLNNRYYSVIREIDNGKLELIKDQEISLEENIIPFNILKTNNIYTVELNSLVNKRNKLYKFKVASRYNEVILGEIDKGEIVQPDLDKDDNIDTNPQSPIKNPIPEIDNDMITGNGFIRFDYSGTNIKTSIGSSKLDFNGNYKTYATGSTFSNGEVFDTNVSISFNNNNGKCESSITNNNNSAKAKTQQKDDFGQMNINQINVTLVGDIKYDIKIQRKGADGSGNGGNWSTLHEKSLAREGKYLFNIPYGKDIEITGKLTKTNNKSNGSIIITFGTRK